MEAVKRERAPHVLTPTRVELTCKEAVSAMGDYLAAALTPKHRLHIDQHLKDCAECAAFLRTYKKTIEAMHNALTNGLPAPVLKLRKPPQAHCRATLTRELLK
jgi:hypothetical protein